MFNRRLSSLNRRLFQLIKTDPFLARDQHEVEATVHAIHTAQHQPAKRGFFAALGRLIVRAFFCCFPNFFTRPAHIDAHDDDGNTALIVASAQVGQATTVRTLLAHGAEVNAVSHSRTTSLTWAAYYGRLDTVHELLAAKADVNRRNLQGNTALMCAAHHGQVKVVGALLEAKADPGLLNHAGETALTWAAFNGHTSVVDTLLKSKEVKLEQVNGADKSALDAAIANDRFAVIATLLKNGAVLKNPEALARRMRQLPDQRNPLILDILAEIVNQQDKLLETTEAGVEVRLSEDEYKKVKIHFLQLKVLRAEREVAVAQEVYDAVPVLPKDLAKLMASYDDSLARMGMFGRLELHDKLQEVAPGLKIKL